MDVEEVRFRGRAAVRRLEARARERRRGLSSYLLALSTSPAPHGDNNSIAVRASRVVPFARQLRQGIRRRPEHRSVEVDRLLMGAQGGKDARAFASSTGNLAYGSTLMSASPHVELLQLAVGQGGMVTDEQIRSSRYWVLAKEVTAVAGGWFGAHDDEELTAVTRNFVDWALGRCDRVTALGGSPFDDSVLVSRVSRSPMYQVIDGHHRVAAAIAKGHRQISVHCTWMATETPLQSRLLELSGGARSLCQPVRSSEVAGWTVTVNCADRLMRILRFLERDLGGPSARTYLDVGSGLGWYLGEMQRFGYDVLGIEPDDRQVQVGISFYGLSATQVRMGDLTHEIEELAGPYDVVTCFELPGLLQRCGTPLEATRLIKGLDRVSGRVLIVDTDEPAAASEQDQVAADRSLTSLIFDNTSFRTTVDLGANFDGTGSRTHVTGRRLLAFVR